MTKEQEEAIEYLEQFIGKEKEYKHKPIKIKTLTNTRNAIETVLSMLKENSAEIEQKNTKLAEKNAEIEKKDKIIDLMAKYIDSNNYVDNEECQFQWDFKIEKCNAYYCRNCIKQHFENEVKK